jgi:hypothetical protein
MTTYKQVRERMDLETNMEDEQLLQQEQLASLIDLRFLNRLSPLRREIEDCLRANKSNAEIAHFMGLTPQEVAAEIGAMLMLRKAIIEEVASLKTN